MDVLDKTLNVLGTDMKSFIDARKEFEKCSKMSVDDFSTLPFEIFWFYQTENPDYVSFFEINDEAYVYFDKYGKIEFARKKFRKKDIPNSIAESIEDGNIPCAIQLKHGKKNVIYFVDKICISRIVAKTQISSTVYDQGVIGAIILYDGLKKYDKPLSTVLRTQDGFWRMMSINSVNTDFVDAIETVKNEEKLTSFELVKWNITQCMTYVELENKEINQFVPCICLQFSDTGHGICKKMLGLKTLNSETPIYIGEYKDNNEFTNLYNKLVERINSISSNDNVNALSFLNNKKIKHAIGKKRIEMLKKYFSKNMPSKNAYLNLVRVPDLIGSINYSSDVELKFTLGTIFSTGISL